MWNEEDGNAEAPESCVLRSQRGFRTEAYGVASTEAMVGVLAVGQASLVMYNK